MRFIFFDLETSDRNTIGQILNYAFIATDQYFQPRAELCGQILLSRLQLPSPQAILVNRINVLEHQRSAKLNEAQGMREIARFIQTQLEEAQRDNEPGGVALSGYNISRFDVPFLRTSLIRNGINPYFGGQLRYRDLLHLVRYTYLQNEAFPAPGSPDDPNRLSLSLESVSRKLGLLQAAQSHDSYQDALLTVELARRLQHDFAAKLSDFDPYQARSCEDENAPGRVWLSRAINYRLDLPPRWTDTPLVLHDFNHKEALWIDLEKYKQGAGRQSLFWVNKNSGALFLAQQTALEAQPLIDTAAAARAEFVKVRVHNFFQKSSCDIEQDIYRLDFDSLAALEQAIWRGDPKRLAALKTRDAKVLFRRFQLANHHWGAGSDQRMHKMLREYAGYRYGGKIKLEKFQGPDLEAAGQQSVSWKELVAGLASLTANAQGEDRVLLDALTVFYQESDIYKLLETELGTAAASS